MTTYLGKSCSFCLPRVPFVNCRQFMYLVISLLVLRAGYGIWLYQFLIIAYLFTFLNRWTESCSDIYNYVTNGDPIVLDCPQIPDEEHHPILREEVEATVKALKMGKSAGVDNIPAELVQAEGEAMIDILTSICNKIWKTGKWPTTWTQSLVIILPKKGNLQLCQNYRTISLISHPSKVMLKIILSRLQSQAEGIIAEEQAGSRAGRSTTEQIFNLRILCEKYLQHQQNLYHVFIDFKKAFDRAWHQA